MSLSWPCKVFPSPRDSLCNLPFHLPFFRHIRHITRVGVIVGKLLIPTCPSCRPAWLNFFPGLQCGTELARAASVVQVWSSLRLTPCAPGPIRYPCQGPRYIDLCAMIHCRSPLPMPWMPFKLDGKVPTGRAWGGYRARPMAELCSTGGRVSGEVVPGKALRRSLVGSFPSCALNTVGCRSPHSIFLVSSVKLKIETLDVESKQP